MNKIRVSSKADKLLIALKFRNGKDFLYRS